MTYAERKKYYLELIETELAKSFKPIGISFDGLLEAMDYSLMAGGKRLRPMLVLEMCRACGGNPEDAIDAACAVEMLHTYSLIHDDLPCMDNDELRRGKPTSHMVYGECNAVLAGDALQAEAFGKILRSNLPAAVRAACAEALAGAAGVDGICGGQFLDMNAEGKFLSEDEITDIHSRKTGSLITAACRMGALIAESKELVEEDLAGKHREWFSEREEKAIQYGAALGLAFQARDDMLDVLSTDEELGKPIGSDEREHKSTYMTLYGEEKCQEFIEKLTKMAKSIAMELKDGEFLCALADELAGRKS